MARPFLALLLAASLFACDGKESPGPDGGAAEPEQPYNVVLIVMDTTRADHIGCYGYERDTTPNVDAFARHATRFPNAMSTAPWTLPSHSSMFTGVPPHEHGAHTFWVEQRENNVAPLPEDVPVIAEAFREQGYRTAGFAANNVFLTPRWGLNRGFETYSSRHAYAKVHNRRVFDWLDGDAEEPFFLFVNYIDSHRPYNIAPVPGFIRRVDRNKYLIDQLRRKVMGGEEPFPEQIATKVIAQYDTALRHMDAGIGDLLVELDRRGLRDHTIIIVTADHGEYFGEHQMVEHNMDVYQPGVHVPLIVDSPGEKAGVDETVLTSTNLAWLIRERMNDDGVREALEPFAVEPGSEPLLSENYYSRPWDVFSDQWGDRFRRVRRALYDWPYKLIHSSDGHHELYDLEVDPDEMMDLAEVEPERVQRMVRIVEQELEDEQTEGDTDQSLSDLEVEQMRALGYVQ